MKALLIPLVACAGLAGCATYGDPYGYGYGYGNGGYYGSAYPTYPAVSGSIYYSNTPNHDYGRGDHRSRQYRDRDRDGVPNRADYDRDGDGVPNNMDSRPNNPRRR
jgi:hypothetical protein